MAIASFRSTKLQLEGGSSGLLVKALLEDMPKDIQNKKGVV
jgi:hypothetical protein